MKHNNKITTDAGVVIILLVCIVISCVLILLGHDNWLAISRGLAPKIALLFCYVTLCSEWKLVHLSKEELHVRYITIFYIRRIPWARINSIELVLFDRHCYLFISLDNCPSFCEAKQKPGPYMLKHPVKLIFMQIDGEKIKEYKQIISEYFPNVSVIDKKTENKTGDDSLS